MISEVDGALSALLKAEALRGSQAEIAFDAPTTDWAARRNGPVVDVFLYDIREDTTRRDAGVLPERDPTTRKVTGRRPGLRYFRLSYLLTAWTKRPEDEHLLLQDLLVALLRHDRIPVGYLRGGLAEETVLLGLAMPPSPDRSLTDLWSALGGEMKPSLDLQVVAPIRPDRQYDVNRTVDVRQVSVGRKQPPVEVSP